MLGSALLSSAIGGEQVVWSRALKELEQRLVLSADVWNTAVAPLGGRLEHGREREWEAPVPTASSAVTISLTSSGNDHLPDEFGGRRHKHRHEQQHNAEHSDRIAHAEFGRNVCSRAGRPP